MRLVLNSDSFGAQLLKKHI